MPKQTITSGDLNKIERYIYGKTPEDWTETKACRFSRKLAERLEPQIIAAIIAADTLDRDEYKKPNAAREGNQ